MTKKVRFFSLRNYVETALAHAEYERDEDGVVVAQVPNASGFFAQGETFEEARFNLGDVIEGNILLALQLDFELPAIEGFIIEEQDDQAVAA